MKRQLDTPRLWRHFDLRNSALDRTLRRSVKLVEPPPTLLVRLLAALFTEYPN